MKPTPPAVAVRDRRITEARAARKSLSAIGAAEGISKQRVCQILQRIAARRAAMQGR